MGKSAPFTKLK